MPQTAKQQKIQKDGLQKVAERYAVLISDEVRETVNPDDPNDPVALQYFPSIKELETTAGELEDPIGDEAHSPVKGIVHRYPDRVLLKPVHVCAVYCRFCFRREKVGPGSETLTQDELAKAFAYIRNTPQIWEVIVTGGDPFVLSPRRLRALMQELEGIEHVKVIRFHTRVPVATPSRITDELVQAISSSKTVYTVLHCNHPNELSEKVQEAAQKFIRAGIPLLSQSTLLKGVNNNADVLEKLFRRLVEFKITPYYLHHPDLAPGTSHFRLPLKEGLSLMQKVFQNLSGIARPSYMLDIPGGFGKVPVAENCREISAGTYIVTDAQGHAHDYKDE